MGERKGPSCRASLRGATGSCELALGVWLRAGAGRCELASCLRKTIMTSKSAGSSPADLFLCQNRPFLMSFIELRSKYPALQSPHNNSWGWVSLLVAWNALTRSILLACDFVKASQCIAIVAKEEDVMCFRSPPDTTSGPLICPECGKEIVSPNF